MMRMTLPEKEEQVLIMTDEKASTDLSEEGKRAMKMRTEAMNSGCSIYIVSFHDLEELHEHASGEEQS